MTTKPDLKSMMLAAIRMPTEDELNDSAKRRLSAVRDTYIENWPADVLAMSIPTVILPLTEAAVDALIERWSTTWGGAPKAMPAETVDAELAALSARIDAAISSLGGSAFVRLGSRSPKDCPAMMDGNMAAKSGAQGVSMLTESMERIYEDLSMARRSGYQPTVCVRQFLDWLTPDREIRVFVEDGQISGLTQYHIQDGAHPWLVSNAAEVEASIRSFIAHQLHPAMHIQSYTVDFAMRSTDEPVMLEINPRVTMGLTFPGLFRGEDLDGSFRILTEAAQ